MTVSCDPNPNPLLPPPIRSNKTLVILLTNAVKLDKSDKPTGFEIRELAHICEILLYYFTRTPTHDYPGDQEPSKPSGNQRPILSWESSMNWNWIKDHFIIASLRGGEVPIEPSSLEAAKVDLVTKEFMSCKALMDMIRHTTKLTDIDPTSCYGCIIPGGHGCLQDLAVSNESARWLYRLYNQDSKSSPGSTTAHKGVIATVCHGTAALLPISANGEALKDPNDEKEPRWISDKKITCFSDEEERQLKMDKNTPYMLEERMRKTGVTIDNAPAFETHVVIDDRLITAQNAESVRAMVRAFVRVVYKMLGGSHHDRPHHPGHVPGTNCC